MKKTKLKYAVLIGFLLIAALFYRLGRGPFKEIAFNNYYLSDEPVLAIFDKDHSSILNPGQIVHYKAVLKNTGIWAQGSFEEDMKTHDLLITVETWLKGTSYNNNVLQELVEGKFDRSIRQLAKSAAKSKHKVFIRWAPEMEVPVKDYPWQFQSSAYYSTAFNYFANRIKKHAPNVQVVWGPSGYPGDTEYWPGNQEVDFVSITLGGRGDNSLDAYPKEQTIPDMLRNKLHRLRFIDKPVLIVKASGIPDFDFKAGWLKDQQEYMANYKSTIYSANNFTDTGRVKPERKHLAIGAYDPNKKLLHQKHITVEHLFTDWGEVQRGDFERNFLEVIKRNHNPIVTMEPWRDGSGKVDSNTLANILSGKYDTEIRKLFKIIASVKNTVYLRWMHEMEIPIHRYAWQSQDPVEYINTFRYFMQFEGGPAKNVKKVWGPAGDRGSIDFWPGDDVVDFISIAIYGLPDKNITDPEKQETFSVIFERKFRRMRFSDKPLFITEFGVKGPEVFQDKWLGDAAKTINAYPQVFGVCYFNLYDNPDAWGEIKAPDWSISPKSMQKFAAAIVP